MTDTITQLMPKDVDYERPYKVKAYSVDITMEPQVVQFAGLKLALYHAMDMAMVFPWHRVEVGDIYGRAYASFNALWDRTADKRIRSLITGETNDAA